LYTKTVTVPATTIGSTNFPADPSRTGYFFRGWNTQTDGGGSGFTASTAVTGNITVYAWWGTFDDLSLNAALMWISINATTGDAYTITLRNNETISPKSLSYGGKMVGITLTGGTTERTISLSTTGTLFMVENGVTLTLGNNVTLQGRSNNMSSLIRVNSGGRLVMNTGSNISSNTNSSSSSCGGGVYVDGGTFAMSGGNISSNTVSSSTGGGVYVENGTFTMSGGEISGNTVSSSYFDSVGGGVYVGSGTFTMSDGKISGNTASSSSSSAGGGGVYSSGTFTMSGGEISGNTASSSSSDSAGGGVYVASGTFTKQPGGVIYGSNESNSVLRNTATSGDNYGHAVYVYGPPAKKRNTTAGTGVTLNSGAAGGWE
jgi:uncharacterized repeat protein (TIGR02543 family)